MKVVGSCMTLLCLVGILLLSFNCFCGGVPLRSGITINVDRRSTTTRPARVISRNLKDNIDHRNGGVVSLEDYRPYDPSPSSKASVRPGPIEHGSPTIPYIPDPKPSPPRSSDNDGGDSP